MPAGKTVAVINGLIDTIEMLRMTLEHAGFAVVDGQARDFRIGQRDLAEFVREHRVDVVLFDVAIPYEDNWRFLKAAMASDPLSTTPFVVTTTNQAALRQWSGEVSVIELFGKPYDLDLVVQAVRAAANGAA